MSLAAYALKRAATRNESEVATARTVCHCAEASPVAEAMTITISPNSE